jgi:hypothetical protein
MKHKEVWFGAFLWLLPSIVMAEDVIQIGLFNKDAAIIAAEAKGFLKKKTSAFKSIPSAILLLCCAVSLAASTISS